MKSMFSQDAFNNDHACTTTFRGSCQRGSTEPFYATWHRRLPPAHRQGILDDEAANSADFWSLSPWAQQRWPGVPESPCKESDVFPSLNISPSREGRKNGNAPASEVAELDLSDCCEHCDDPVDEVDPASGKGYCAAHWTTRSHTTTDRRNP